MKVLCNAHFSQIPQEQSIMSEEAGVVAMGIWRCSTVLYIPSKHRVRLSRLSRLG